MVAGKKAFPAGSGGAFEKAVQRVSSTPLPPSSHVKDIPKNWERTVLQCLARDPGRRPESAREVIAGLTGGGSAQASGGKRWLAGSVAALAALALAFAGGGRLGFFRSAPPPPARQHIAVLAFHLPGQDPEMEVFADGLVEGITGRLSQFEGPNARLMVVPSSVVRKQGVQTPEEAKAKLGVDEVVQGTLQTEGQRVRLLLTLVDTHQMRQIASVIVDDKRSNALSLEDAAVEKLAHALSLRVLPEHAKDAVSTLAPGAYEYYLQARGYLQRADKLSSLDSAIALFQRVLELDNRSALALAGLAEAYRAKFSLTRDSRWIDEALRNCRHALELNPSLPDAHIILGRIHMATGHPEEARQDFSRALEFDARDSRGYQGLAAAYEGLKQFEQAEATYRKAVALRPEDWSGYAELGVFYYNRGELDKAIEQYRQVVALTPDNAQGYSNLGAFQMQGSGRRCA